MYENLEEKQEIEEILESVMQDDYSKMIEKIGITKYKERFLELKRTMDCYLEITGYASSVECNQRILAMLLLDYWSDIFRMKDFHMIERSRTDKIFSYLVAWIIRRKPLQFKGYFEDEHDIFVNERFCAFLLLNECLLSGNKRIDIKYYDKLDEYVDLILYHLKYRECNPKALELLIRSFEMGTYTITNNQETLEEKS